MACKTTVSVIMIFLNAGQFIDEAITSVFGQTYADWELLLVDDGSTDKSTSIAQSYVERFPEKVRYFEHPDHQNLGMSATRNLGIRHARGEYITFLDADDVLLPNALEIQTAILEAHPEAAMVYGRKQWWYSWTGDPEDVWRDFVDKPKIPVDTLYQPPSILIALLQKRTYATSSVMVRRQVVQAVGGCEGSFHGLYEDQAFFVKVCCRVSVFVSSAWWCKYRQHPASCCAEAARACSQHEATLAFLHWTNQYLTEQGIQDRAVWQALEWAMRPYHYPHRYRLNKIPAYVMSRINQGLSPLVPVARQVLPLHVYHRLQMFWKHVLSSV